MSVQMLRWCVWTMPGPRAMVGIPQNRFKPPVMVLLTLPRRCSWCGSCLSDLNTGLFHIIIVENYDDIPDDLVVKVILARNTLHLVAALLATYDDRIARSSRHSTKHVTLVFTGKYMHVWMPTCWTHIIQDSPNVHLSRDMTKPTKWVCAQRRLSSAWVLS